jgi:hypothetical protein
MPPLYVAVYSVPPWHSTGPVVRLAPYGIWGVARYAEVHKILNDWETFCSSRGAGLTDACP